MVENLVFNALQCPRLGQRFRLQGNAEALVDLDGQLDGHDGCQADIAQHRRKAEVLGVDDLGDDAVDFLLQHIERSLYCLLRLSRNRQNGLWQRFLVDLLVLVEWDGINLHRHGGHHIGRLAVEDEVVQGLDVHLLVADDVGRDELASAILVESLHGGVLDAGELTDDGLDFLEFDAETANLHLSVLAAYELDVARGQVAHNVTGAVAARIFMIISYEGVVDKHLCRLFRTVQITERHLWTANPQFSGSTYRQTVSLLIDNIQTHVVERLADRYLLQLLIYCIGGREDSTFCRSVCIMEFIAGWRSQRCQLLTTR